MIMQISLEQNTAKNQIDSYTLGQITINQTVYTQSILVTADIIQHWDIQTIHQLQRQHFDDILALKPELIILGTGKKLSFPAQSLCQSILLLGIGLEIMDTPSACRTFNILIAEDRNVVGALIIE